MLQVKYTLVKVLVSKKKFIFLPPTLSKVVPILPVSFGVSRAQNFLTGEGRMSRIQTSFICIGKEKNNHLERGEDQTKKQNTSQRSYSISSSFRVIIR